MIISIPCEPSFSPNTLKICRKSTISGTSNCQITTKLVTHNFQSSLFCWSRNIATIVFYHVAIFFDQFICWNLWNLFVKSQFHTWEQCGMICYMICFQCFISLLCCSINSCCNCFMRILTTEVWKFHLVVCSTCEDQCNCVCTGYSDCWISTICTGRKTSAFIDHFQLCFYI